MGGWVGGGGGTPPPKNARGTPPPPPHRDSDLCGGYRYAAFEQLGPGVLI